MQGISVFAKDDKDLCYTRKKSYYNTDLAKSQREHEDTTDRERDRD